MVTLTVAFPFESSISPDIVGNDVPLKPFLNNRNLVPSNFPLKGRSNLPNFQLSIGGFGSILHTNLFMTSSLSRVVVYTIRS